MGRHKASPYIYRYPTKSQRAKLFYRGSNIDNHKGVGLFIAQQLVNVMSGSISLADNPEERGTIVTIQLPLSIDH